MSTLSETASPVKFSSPLLRKLSPERRAKVERAAVIGFLVFECLSVTKDLARDLEHHHNFSQADFVRRQIRSVPTEAENIIISHACLDRFGSVLLSASGLFYGFGRCGPCDCFEWTSKCRCNLSTWRLDVNPTLARRGLILPLSDRRSGFFNDLLVYRHACDESPFALKVRADTEVAA